jgi:hypothetical protein
MNQLVKQVLIAVGVVGIEKIVNYVLTKRKTAA